MVPPEKIKIKIKIKIKKYKLGCGMDVKKERFFCLWGMTAWCNVEDNIIHTQRHICEYVTRAHAVIILF